MSKDKFPIGKENVVCARIWLHSKENSTFDCWRGTCESYKHFEAGLDYITTRVNIADVVWKDPRDVGILEKLSDFAGNIKEKIFRHNKQKSEKKWEESKVEPGFSIERVLERFFNECNGQTDVLNMDASLLISTNSWREDPSTVTRLKEALAGRPISTILYIQSDITPCPNNPTPTFLREYIDYRMFYIENFDEKPLEISDKLLKCEFLCLKCDVTNPERLKEFEGWGLVLDKTMGAGFDFEYFYNIVQTWYSGRSVQYRYLGLNCDADEEKWNSLISMGQEVIYDGGYKDIKLV